LQSYVQEQALSAIGSANKTRKTILSGFWDYYVIHFISTKIIQV
jgi:hypothetical protein